MIFAIESSCDESALSLFDPLHGLLGEWVYSQVQVHTRYGGVVPDLASRDHLEHFTHLLELALERLGELDQKVDAIAVTVGPGLAGSLALGISLAKALSLSWNIPVVAANHLLGHAYSPFIAIHAKNPADFSRVFEEHLPHLGLLVSGGNTQLFEINKQGMLSILAKTEDDAVGEALDKGARLLGLGYPGGPKLEAAAVGGNPNAYDFPRACRDHRERRFSFSGLKTSLRYLLEKMSDEALAVAMPDLCASYQAAAVDALLIKTKQVLEERGGYYQSLGLSGGVANNHALRNGFGALSKLPVLLAEPKHTGDNAAMIAFAAWLEQALNRKARILEVTPMLSLER
jgi:N6-L-threonylcarbamoyladenine synthase